MVHMETISRDSERDENEDAAKLHRQISDENDSYEAIS